MVARCCVCNTTTWLTALVWLGEPCDANCRLQTRKGQLNCHSRLYKSSLLAISTLASSRVKTRICISPATYKYQETNFNMKFQATFGTLVTLAVAALAVPVENVSERVVLSGDQLKSIINVFKNSGKPDILAPDQTISCSVAYTLALSIALNILFFLCICWRCRYRQWSSSIHPFVDILGLVGLHSWSLVISKLGNCHLPALRLDLGIIHSFVKSPLLRFWPGIDGWVRRYALSDNSIIKDRGVQVTHYANDNLWSHTFCYSKSQFM